MPGAAATIAVVIPTLNEAARIAEILTHTRHLGFDDYVVVDGGSTDDTVAVAQQLPAQPPVRVMSSQPGRAIQMNIGAAAVTCDVLLFLHADTRLPADARHAVLSALADPHCVGGRFDVAFDRRTYLSRTIAGLMNLRSRLTGMMTGDQAMFVRTETFRRLGGFAELPLMEDLDFSRRLAPLGRIAALRTRVTTSYRRWEQQGPIRTILRMWALRLLYWAGVSPHTLAQHYRLVR